MMDLHVGTSENISGKRNRRPSVKLEDFCDPDIDFLMPSPKKYNKIHSGKGSRIKNNTKNSSNLNIDLTQESERQVVGKKGVKAKNVNNSVENTETLENESDAFGRFSGKGLRGKNVTKNTIFDENLENESEFVGEKGLKGKDNAKNVSFDESLVKERNFVGQQGLKAENNANGFETLENESEFVGGKGLMGRNNANDFETLDMERDALGRFAGEGPRGINVAKNTNIGENLDIERDFVEVKGLKDSNNTNISETLGTEKFLGKGPIDETLGVEREFIGKKGLKGYSNANNSETLGTGRDFIGIKGPMGRNDANSSETLVERGFVGQKGLRGRDNTSIFETLNNEEIDKERDEIRDYLGQKEPRGVNSEILGLGEERDVFGQKGPRGKNAMNFSETLVNEEEDFGIGLVVKKCGKGPRGISSKNVGEGVESDILGQNIILEDAALGEERCVFGKKGPKGSNSKNLAEGEEKEGERPFLGQKRLWAKIPENVSKGEEEDFFIGEMGPMMKNSENLAEDGENDLLGEKWTSGWNDTDIFEMLGNDENNWEEGKLVYEGEDRDLIGGWGVTKSKNKIVCSNREFTKVDDEMDIEGRDEVPHHSPVKSLGNEFSREFEAEDIGVAKDFEMEPSDSDEKNWNGERESNAIRVWLDQLGLGRYAPVFQIHEVDEEVLPMLTIEDLKDMGIHAVGSRRKIYSAIQKLNKEVP